MYINSNTILNNNNKNHALFLAAVLVVGGVMGISSPSLNAFAQEYENYGYEHEEEYDSYDPHQYKKNDKSGSYRIANCDNNNEINIGINQEQSLTARNQQDDSADTTTLNGQEVEN